MHLSSRSSLYVVLILSSLLVIKVIAIHYDVKAGLSFGECTSTTCSGPVRLHWDEGTSCHNASQALVEQLTTGESTMGQCVARSVGWAKQVCQGGFFVDLFYKDSECTNLTTSRAYQTGKCVSYSNWGQAQVYLCNVNDTFVASPGTVDVSVPEYTDSTTFCTGANNCTEDGQYATTYFSADCRPDSVSMSFERTVSSGFRFDTCLVDRSSTENNIVYSCDSQWFTISYYQDGGCSGTPYQQYKQTKSCIRPEVLTKRQHLSEDGLELTSGAVADYRELFCPGAPPVAPPTVSMEPSSSGPSSDASSNLYMAYLWVLALSLSLTVM